MKRLLVIVSCLLAIAACDTAEEPATETIQGPLECTPDDQLALFEQRIEPLIADDRSPSCMKCHLPGTDFSEYVVKDDPCATMLCLFDHGLINLAEPEESKMLDWIKRGQEQAESSLITDEVVKGEYDAMKQWIEFTARCGSQVCEPIDDPCGYDIYYDQPDMDEEVDMEPPPPPPELTIENYPCEEDGVVRAYNDHPFYWRGRCSHCHVPNPPTNEPGPAWMSRYTDLDQGARETVANILANGYVNLENPDQSLIILKPLTRDEGGIEHGGGDKLLMFDELYDDLVKWTQLVQACEPGEQ